MKTILVKNDSTRYDDDGDNCKRKLNRIYKQELKKFNNFSRIVSNFLKVMKTILVKNDTTRYDEDGVNCKRKERRIYKEMPPEYNNFSRIINSLLNSFKQFLSKMMAPDVMMVATTAKEN